MKRRIGIIAGTLEVAAELNDTGTADAIWKALPLVGRVNLWGDEMYFSTPLKLQQDREQEVVEAGDLAYWPPGNAICIFLGPTPASKDNEIRPASPVTVFGKVLGDITQLRKTAEGTEITIRRKTEAQDD